MTARWRTLPDERMELYSPIGLKPIDEFTGRAAIGTIRYLLDILESPGVWRETDTKPVVTWGGVVTYPRLERCAEPGGQPRKYRVRVEAEFYRPFYRATADGIEFDAYSYSNTTPPQNLNQIRVSQPKSLILTPLPQYPFPGHVPVLRGAVNDAAGKPVGDVTVSEGTRERVVTDARGVFALPLRWVGSNAQVNIDATDQRKGRSGSITIQLPQDLATSHTISIS
jgi:hypothetical protein